MAGIFQSMLHGMNQARGERRQRREDEYIAGERAYQQQRRGVTDQWQDEDRAYEVGIQRPLKTESAQLGVEQQRFDVGRQPVLAAQQDAKHQQGMVAGELANQASRFSLGRMPVEARQKDQRFGVEMQGAQQGNVMRALQIGSAERAAQIEAAQQPGKLDEIRLERERKATLDAVAKSGQQFMLTGMQGDKQRAAQIINQTWAQATNDPDGDAGVRVNEQGQYYLEGPDGRPALMLGDEDQVMQYAFQFLSDPSAFAQSRQATYAARAAAQSKEAEARATQPQRFVETMQQPDGTVAMVDRATGTARTVTDAKSGQPVRGNVQGQGGSVPAKLQVAQAYFQRMQRRPGESDGDAWIRAFHESNQRSEVSPTAAARDFYASTVRALSQSARNQQQRDRAQQQAAQMTQDYMDRFFPGQELPLEALAEVEAAPQQGRSASGLLGAVSPTFGMATDLAGRIVGSGRSGQAPASASGLRSRQPVQPAAQADQPVRTGIDNATGRRVGQFADGSVRFID